MGEPAPVRAQKPTWGLVQGTHRTETHVGHQRWTETPDLGFIPANRPSKAATTEHPPGNHRVWGGGSGVEEISERKSEEAGRSRQSGDPTDPQEALKGSN